MSVRIGQQFNCKDGEYNEVASYFHNTWEVRARHVCVCATRW